jgi:hypothetical protein
MAASAVVTFVVSAILPAKSIDHIHLETKMGA